MMERDSKMLYSQGNWLYGWVRGTLFVGLSVAQLGVALQAQTVTPTQPPPISAPAASSISGDGSQKGPAQTKEARAGTNSTLRLGDGDLVEVGVYDVPELSSKARVDSNGDLYLPLIDYVHVAGLTLDEAQRVVEKKLEQGGFVKNPHVSIFVDEYASQGVSVLGEVAKPGIYPALGDQRLLDLISAAGGLNITAGHVITVTHRDPKDNPVTVELSKNLTDSPESNIDISPGDTVVVHKADIIYVVGDVARPSGLLIDRGSLTVLQAVALAGGTTATSKPNGARILHKGPEGITETPIQLKKILQARAADVPMKPDDILFVPSSVFKTAFISNASIALQATSLGLVAVR
jgi:polysaccharide biosynthesis/export protein